MKKKLHNKKLGKLGENKACEYLEQNKYSIITRNFNTKYGEIDIVASRHGILYCIEVKTRTSTAFGQPFEAINRPKLNRMIISAQIFCQAAKFDGEVKLALIEILGDSLKMTELE